jgi:hypothetical protein
MVTICEESWYPMMEIIDNSMERIKTNLNQSFNNVDNDLIYLLTESRRKLQNKLQDNIVALAVQQRNIVIMDRQLNAALELIPLINITKITYYLPYNMLLLQIIIALILGIFYSKIFK